MRFVSYVRDDNVRHGMIDPDDDTTILDVGAGDLLVALENGGLAAAAAQATSRNERVQRDNVRIVAPMRRPPKLLAVAANYAEHVTNSGMEPVDPDQATPRLFLKPSSAIVAHDDPIELPGFATKVDWEVELAVVIGERCRNVPEDQAMDVVAGYMTANDVSARAFDFGFHRREQDLHPFFDWLAGKWLDGFAPFGPYLVSADAVADPHALDLRLEVNGQVRQQGSTGDMIFSISRLIAFASQLMTLEPGDVIETGTPAGAGVETDAVYLADGDVMVASVGDLGEIRSPVKAT